MSAEILLNNDVARIEYLPQDSFFEAYSYWQPRQRGLSVHMEFSLRLYYRKTTQKNFGGPAPHDQSKHRVTRLAVGQVVTQVQKQSDPTH